MTQRAGRVFSEPPPCDNTVDNLAPEFLALVVLRQKMMEEYTPEPPVVRGRAEGELGRLTVGGSGEEGAAGFLGIQDAQSTPALENISVFIYRPVTDARLTQK